jgi:NitT/TauT family transport system ATP-binding protein
MKNILEIKNLKKIYHTKDKEILAVENFTLDIKEGEFIGIVGPSGCGKSTILNVLCGLEEKSGGNINIKKDSKIGYMLQQDSLFEWRNILNNCLLGLEINNNLNKDTKKRVINLLEDYGLKDFIYSYPDNLSGGMIQRVVRILYTHGIITYKRLITLINKEKEVYYVIR